MILDKKKLEKYMEHHQEVADRNYRTYQETGIARYDYAYRRAEEHADIARLALYAADEHMKLINYESVVAEWAHKAMSLFRDWNEQQAMDLCRSISVYAKNEGLVWDRYK